MCVYASGRWVTIGQLVMKNRIIRQGRRTSRERERETGRTALGGDKQGDTGRERERGREGARGDCTRETRKGSRLRMRVRLLCSPQHKNAHAQTHKTSNNGNKKQQQGRTRRRKREALLQRSGAFLIQTTSKREREREDHHVETTTAHSLCVYMYATARSY